MLQIQTSDGNHVNVVHTKQWETICHTINQWCITIEQTGNTAENLKHLLMRNLIEALNIDEWTIE